MEQPFAQAWSFTRDMVDLTKRVFSLELQFSAFKRIRILDDLDDVEVLYEDPASKPVDGDVLTYDGARELWVPGSSGPTDGGGSGGGVAVAAWDGLAWSQLYDGAADGNWGRINRTDQVSWSTGGTADDDSPFVFEASGAWHVSVSVTGVTGTDAITVRRGPPTPSHVDVPIDPDPDFAIAARCIPSRVAFTATAGEETTGTGVVFAQAGNTLDVLVGAGITAIDEVRVMAHLMWVTPVVAGSCGA